MAFKKGQSGNPNGRKPGVPNKITTETRVLFKAMLEDFSPPSGEVDQADR